MLKVVQSPTIILEGGRCDNTVTKMIIICNCILLPIYSDGKELLCYILINRVFEIQIEIKRYYISGHMFGLYHYLLTEI